MDSRDEISKARVELARAEEKLFDVYITKVKEKYLACSQDKRQIILNRLEDLLTNSLRRNETELINPKKAREIRIKAGLTQIQLAKILGASQNLFSMYELGKMKRETECSRKYLAWLRENGYEE